MPFVYYYINQTANFEMRQILNNIREHGSIQAYADNLSSDERFALRWLIDKCKLVSEIAEDELY